MRWVRGGLALVGEEGRFFCWKRVDAACAGDWTMMGAGQLLVILLCCVSSGRCNEEELDILYITGKSTEEVIVPCPNMSADDATFKLYKDNETVKQITSRNTQQRQSCNQTQKADCSEEDKTGTYLGFNVGRKQITKKAVYKCEGTRTYPPPVITKERILILVPKEGDECPCKTEICKKDPKLPKTVQLVWIWITVVALLSTYSLALTIVTLVIWHKMKDADSQNDYINTKPRAPPNRRKKRGLQLPVQKHF